MDTPGSRDIGAGNWVKGGKGGWEGRAKLVAWRQVLSKFGKRARKGTPRMDASSYELPKAEDLRQGWSHSLSLKIRDWMKQLLRQIIRTIKSIWKNLVQGNNYSKCVRHCAWGLAHTELVFWWHCLRDSNRKPCPQEGWETPKQKPVTMK